MDDPVETGFSDKLALEDVVPVGYWELAAENQGFASIPVIDYLFESVRSEAYMKP